MKNWRIHGAALLGVYIFGAAGALVFAVHWSHYLFAAAAAACAVALGAALAGFRRALLVGVVLHGGFLPGVVWGAPEVLSGPRRWLAVLAIGAMVAEWLHVYQLSGRAGWWPRRREH